MAYNSSSSKTGSGVFRGFSSRSENTNYKLYDFQLIKQNLINRLNTRKGERVENPEFGTIIYDVLFEPLTETLKEQIATDITRNVNADPRVQASDIVITENQRGLTVEVALTYRPYDVTEKLALTFDDSRSASLT